MTFSQLNLDPTLSKAIQACGYNNPTPIQLRAIPTILEGKDLVASAQTGSGKTGAFVWPALQLLGQTKKGPKARVLILTPTRELATQVMDAAEKYGKFLQQFTIVSLVGGMPYRTQLKKLSRSVDMIIATPGRLMDHMKNHRLDLSGIQMLILDEADRMLDMGFIDDVKFIAKSIPQKRQTLLFSATVDQKLTQMIRQLLNDPIRLDLSNEKIAPTQIKQLLYVADNIQHKNQLLYHFLKEKNMYKAIIFSATKINADKLAKHMRDQGYQAMALHGDLKQSIRNKTIEQFRRGKVQFLVATDVASRGLDISDVTHVINYDLPKFSEDYVHRIGRTGRAGKEGMAISLALPMDIRQLKKIEKLVGRIELARIEGLEPTKGLASPPPDRKNYSQKKKFQFKKKRNVKPETQGQVKNKRTRHSDVKK